MISQLHQSYSSCIKMSQKQTPHKICKVWHL